MSLQRPTHLDVRQIRGRAFSEPLTIQHTQAEFNVYGEPSESVEAESVTLCATAPPTGREDARVRVIMEGGVQLDAIRIFWTVETLHSVGDHGPGDILIFEGERWRVHGTQRWQGFSESIAVRQEGQTVVT